MSNASQHVIDSAAAALAQERLDRGHTWRMMAAKVHGLPEPERNVIRDVPPVVEEPKKQEVSSYFDRWMERQQEIARQQVPSPAPPAVQSQPVATSALPPAAGGATSNESPMSRVRKVAAVGIAGIGAFVAGTVGTHYALNRKPAEPPAIVAPAEPGYGDPLPILRQRGYNLPPSRARISEK